MRQMSADNRLRFARLARSVDRLPAAEQALWKKRVRAWLQHRVHDNAAPDIVGADSDNASEVEWDLWLANKLDGGYQAVSDRVEQVAAKGANAVSVAGFSLWPLAAVAALFLLMKK